jgi:hypothetical protein
MSSSCPRRPSRSARTHSAGGLKESTRDQRKIATDWQGLYKEVFGKPPTG